MSQQKKNKLNYSSWLVPSFDDVKSKESVFQKRKSSEMLKDNWVHSNNDSFNKEDYISLKKNSNSSLSVFLKACEPQNASELAISKQKQQEIFNWLTHRISKGRPSLLVISGPSGCGKTLAFQVLARENDFDIIEWTTPVDTVIDENYRVMRQGDKFEDFLIRATRYNSVLTKQTKRILLVKDFPNVYVEDKNNFFALLEKYHQMGKEPLVFICTETGNSRLLQSLFPDNIRELYNIDLININATTPTAMKNMCKRVSGILNSKAGHFINVTQNAIDEVLANNIGDVRSALLNLIFCSLKVTNTRLKCGSREETVGLLHGIGRVINPKRISVGNSWKFVYDPDDIATFFRSYAKGFSYFLHENYLNTMRSIEEANAAADVLSLADLLNAEWRDPTLSLVTLSVCIRGVMVANEKPVTGWNPVRKPKTHEFNAKRNLELAEIHYYQSMIGTQSNNATKSSNSEMEEIIE